MGAFLLGYGLRSTDLLTTSLGWAATFVGGVLAMILSVFASEDESDWFVTYGWAGILAVIVGFFGGIITATIFLLN